MSGQNKIYLFDPANVCASQQVQLKQGTVEKVLTNARWVDQHSWTPECSIPEWEMRVSIMYPNVEYDESQGKYRIWYHAIKTVSPADGYRWTDHIIDKNNTNGVDLGDFVNTARGTIFEGHDLLCYMESTDGINWVRPELGEFFYQTRCGEIVGTNITRVGLHGQAVRRNENPDPGEPAYLLAGRTWETDSLDHKGQPIGVAVSWSEDGIHWEDPVTVLPGYYCEEDIRSVRADAHNQLLWSPELSKYVIITRGYTKAEPSVRLVVYAQSTAELRSIRDLQKVKAQHGDKYWQETSKYWTCPETILDHGVTLDAQPYTMPAAHMAPNCYIATACMANFDKNTSRVWNSVYARLAWSRDAHIWNYMDGENPFIPNAPIFELKPGNDYGMIYSSAPLQVGDTSQILYSATPELHYVTYADIPADIREIVDRQIPLAAEKKMFTRTSALCIASLKKDRFAGLWSDDGWIITTPLTLSETSLELTADVAEGGWIKLEILDADGAVIPGYEAERFQTVNTDATDKAVAWNGRDLTELVGKTISVRILLHNAGVYTILGGIPKEDA